MSTAAQAADGLSYGGEAYQDDLVRAALSTRGYQLEPSPDGKTVESVEALPYDVILDNEPYPGFLNWFHVTTVPYVVERELLLKVGDSWRKDLAAESARNLRTRLFITSARIVPCKGSTPDKLRVLIVTKDTWSLRPNANFVIVGSTLQSVEAEVTEENVAGRMKRATIDLGLDLAVFYAGLKYRDPRLWGTELTMVEQGDLIWNRTTGALEGGVANFTLQQPLYTLDTRWGWIANLQYRKDIYRLFSNDALAGYRASTGELVPYALDRHRLDLNIGVTRSYGREHKHNITAGYRAFTHQYGIPALGYSPSRQALTDFENSVLPLSENVGLLYLAYQSYEATYRELIDFDSYAITEDTRLGPSVSAELRWANPVLGFSSSFAQSTLGLAWSTYAAGDLFVAAGDFDVRYQPQLSPSSPWVNGLASLSLSNASPRVSLFRLHTSAQVGRRFNDLNHSFAKFGGDNNLRGYPTAYLLGANYWSGNVEVRTLPVVFATVHVGFAAFFDVGAASNDITQLSPHGSVGGGLRIGLPQFNRQILRIDFGVPLEQVPGSGPSYLVAQYGQAF